MHGDNKMETDLTQFYYIVDFPTDTSFLPAFRVGHLLSHTFGFPLLGKTGRGQDQGWGGQRGFSFTYNGLIFSSLVAKSMGSEVRLPGFNS